MRNRNSRSSLFLSCLVVAGLLSGLHSTAVAQADPGIRITTLSSRPDIVSGGTALVRISVPSGVPLTSVMVLLNSQSVTNAFQPEATGNSLLGLVQGVPLGTNELIANVLGQNNQVALS